MKKNITILSAVILILIIVTVTVTVTAQFKDEKTISQNDINSGLQTFSKLVSVGNAQDFGIANAEQLKSLRAGRQFKNYMIRLDDLKKYQAGNDVNTMIKELPVIEVTFTDANGQVVTSIEFTKTNEAWQATGFGITSDLIAVYNNRKAAISDSVISNSMLVRIPALRSSFFAINTATGLNFIPVEDNDNLGFKRGSAVPAEDALSKLAGAAIIYNGLPD